MHKEYEVSFIVSHSDRVEAESPEEAVNIMVRDCPYDGIENIFVTDLETGEVWEMD